MPENEGSLNAFLECNSEYRREWFQQDKSKIFKAYAIDTSAVYDKLCGLGMIEHFEDVIKNMRNCLHKELV